LFDEKKGGYKKIVGRPKWGNRTRKSMLPDIEKGVWEKKKREGKARQGSVIEVKAKGTFCVRKHRC